MGITKASRRLTKRLLFSSMCLAPNAIIGTTGFKPEFTGILKAIYSLLTGVLSSNLIILTIRDLIKPVSEKFSRTYRLLNYEVDRKMLPLSVLIGHSGS